MAAYLTYNHQSEEMAQCYEDLSFEQVHRDILSELPPKGATVLDVGAGSGRVQNIKKVIGDIGGQAV